MNPQTYCPKCGEAMPPCVCNNTEETILRGRAMLTKLLGEMRAKIEHYRSSSELAFFDYGKTRDPHIKDRAESCWAVKVQLEEMLKLAESAQLFFPRATPETTPLLKEIEMLRKDLERAQKPWSVTLVLGDSHEQCEVTSLGHADRIIMVECQGAQKVLKKLSEMAYFKGRDILRRSWMAGWEELAQEARDMLKEFEAKARWKGTEDE